MWVTEESKGRDVRKTKAVAFAYHTVLNPVYAVQHKILQGLSQVYLPMFK